MKKMLSSGLVVAGMLSLPVRVTNPEPPDAASQYRNDPRLKSLKKFFQLGDCPARYLAAEFLSAADQHNLDWRLLPSISIVESSGGRAARHNNMFGWDNGKASFISVRAGIHDMARNLADSKRYRDEDVDGILRKYNPNANYPSVVKSVMRRISPTENYNF
jgi:hypothetical protein